MILKELQWPFTTSAVSSKALEAWNKNKKRFIEVFDLLIDLDEGGFPTHSSTAVLGDSLLTPLELLVQPLRKRFKYHFFGERKTNSKEKVYRRIVTSFVHFYLCVMYVTAGVVFDASV